jgi:hypothetical protein
MLRRSRPDRPRRLPLRSGRLIPPDARARGHRYRPPSRRSQLRTSGLNHSNHASPEIKEQYDLGAGNVNSIQADDTLTKALRSALDDYGVIPRYNPLVVWAGAPHLEFSRRSNDVTFPHHVTRR